MNISRLSDCFAQRYGFHPLRFTPVEGGFSASAFCVETQEGIFFLKVYDKSNPQTAQWTSLADQYMPVLAHLNRDPLMRGRVAEPVPAAGGRYWADDDDFIYIVFTYIHGETVGEKELTTAQAWELGRTLGLLHRYGAADIPGDYAGMTEDFTLPFCDMLEALLRGELPGFDAEAASAVKELGDALARAINRARATAEALAHANLPLVFCHNDAHNYNIMQGESLVLVDWEGLRLAPAEQDMILAVEKPFFQDFLHAYGQVRPEFRMDSAALAFYRVRRDLEDIWAFAERLAFGRLDLEARTNNLKFLKQICHSIHDAL